ncbi:hypothetical protein EDD11_002243 [Mortierella claussenii]|nr:hypothetical protein EDD11_002243 [Mortierella claussenii]
MTYTARPHLVVTLALLLLSSLLTISPVAGQFGLSLPCNNCLVTQIKSLPTCASVNVTDPAQQSTPQYKTCLCDSSFDFNWTKPCSANCQTNELSNFQNNYSNLLKTGLNLTCVKPTPSPTPTPTPNSAPAAGIKTGGLGWEMVVGWAAVVVSSAVLTFLSAV